MKLELDRSNNSQQPSFKTKSNILAIMPLDVPHREMHGNYQQRIPSSSDSKTYLANIRCDEKLL